MPPDQNPDWEKLVEGYFDQHGLPKVITPKETEQARARDLSLDTEIRQAIAVFGSSHLPEDKPAPASADEKALLGVLDYLKVIPTSALTEENPEERARICREALANFHLPVAEEAAPTASTAPEEPTEEPVTYVEFPRGPHDDAEEPLERVGAWLKDLRMPSMKMPTMPDLHLPSLRLPRIGTPSKMRIATAMAVLAVTMMEGSTISKAQGESANTKALAAEVSPDPLKDAKRLSFDKDTFKEARKLALGLNLGNYPGVEIDGVYYTAAPVVGENQIVFTTEKREKLVITPKVEEDIY